MGEIEKEKDMRLIDADKLLDMLFRADLDYESMGGVNYCIDKIDSQPTVEIPQWIPCSDYLPRMKGYKNETEFNVMLNTGEVTSLHYSSNDFDDCFYDCTTNDVIDDVIAWQPLPQPYKRE